MAQKIFVKIDGIPGESPDSRHRDEIEVTAWNWSVSASQGSSGTGAGRKPVIAGITFSHRVDKASPLLLSSCLTGKVAKDATLRIQSSRPDLDNLVFKAQDVLISALVLSDKVEDPYPVEIFLQTGRVDIINELLIQD